MLASLAAISPPNSLLIAAMALFASMVGGVAGYGTGALMPLVLVPMLGPEPVVPIIAISALFNNSWRALAFKHLIDWRRAMLVAAFATPTCIVSAYGYTLLTGKGAGDRDRHHADADGAAALPVQALRDERSTARGSRSARSIYGGAVGGTVGAGVILLSMLMAAGLQGAAVIATDAVISMVVTAVRMAVFGFSGVIDARVIAFALLIGVVALPGAFIAKAHGRAHVAQRPHRDPRRGGADRRRGDDLRRAVHALDAHRSGEAQVRPCSLAQRFAIATSLP